MRIVKYNFVISHCSTRRVFMRHLTVTLSIRYVWGKTWYRDGFPFVFF